jgi:molybdopterin molybdotransferase
MTGAPIPPGVNAVVPVEQTDAQWQPGEPLVLPSVVRVLGVVEAGANIRPVGENVRAGTRILEAGTRLLPQDIGMLASVGQSSVSVVRRPRVAVLSSGDELVDVHEPLAPGKIRDSNSYVIAALIDSHDGEVIRLPIARDTPKSVREMFEAALAQQPDMIVTSGGVSVGAADFIKDVLQEMGEIDFWRINLRPGKPLAFGWLGGVPFFGLPGNPVSVMVTFDVVVRPALQKLAGVDAFLPVVQANLQESVKSDGRRSYVRVKLQYNDGRLEARTTGTQSSGALMSMVLADGLLILPEGTREASAGGVYPVRLLRQFKTRE